VIRFSTRGRYGTRLLMDLALCGANKPVMLKDIARRQDISLPYIAHLISPLIKAGIVKSTRGPKGGLSLAKHPQNIRLSEVILLLEGPIAPAACIDNPKACSHTPLCAARDIWDEVGKATYRVLDSITLQELVERQRQKWDSLHQDNRDKIYSA